MPAKVSRQAYLWYLIALVIVLLDQLSKSWASTQLLYGELNSVTSFFNFTLLHNPGAAFSFLSNAGGWQRWFFAVIALVVSMVLVIWLARIAIKNKREAFALTLILGGALGNLYDRVVLGYVIDFIVLHYHEHSWPAFNIADSAITLGAFLLIIDMFLTKEKNANA